MYFACYFCNKKKKLINCLKCKKIVCLDCKDFSFKKNINHCIFCKKSYIKRKFKNYSNN